MLNRFHTILIIPEKTSKVRKFVVPSWLFRGAAIGLGFTLLLGGVMIVDYWYVMSQIGENKELKMENRRLKQQVQIFKNKLSTVENTMSRIKTFATRLKVITNLEDRGGGLLQSLNSGKLPDASTNTGENSEEKLKTDPTLTSAEANAEDSSNTPNNPVDSRLRKDSEELDKLFTEVNRETLFLEQMLQDQYELLVDQKDFLLATPTRKPSLGYVTSGFGIRKSPYGGRVKMHEGLDIANYPGTPIKAPANGTVIFADSKPGYGKTVIVDHGYGLETWYGHARQLLVSKGQKVRRGDTLAQVGSSGRSTGPHVHYEVRINGTPVNPLSYFLEN